MTAFPLAFLLLLPLLQDDGAKEKRAPKGGEGRAAAQRETPSAEGNVLTFEVTTLDGRKITHENLKGKVVLVDIWGTWCPPCRKAIPSLVELATEMEKKGVVVLGVAFERPVKEKDSKNPPTYDPAKAAEAVKTFVAENKINYPVALGGPVGPDGVAKVFPTLKDFTSYPTLFLIGRDGKVKEVEVGFNKPNFEKFAEHVRKAAAEAPPKARAEK